MIYFSPADPDTPTMPTPNAEFNDLVARSRLTPAQIAGVCGVTVRTVRRWRSGASPAPLAATVILEVIAQQGMSGVTTLGVVALDEWVRQIVLGMREDGLCAVQRRLRLGYGVIGRILRGNHAPS